MEIVIVDSPEASRRQSRDETNASVVRAYAAAVNRKDAKAVAAMWTDDAVLEFPYSPEELAAVIPRRLVGAAIGQWYADILPRGGSIASQIDSLRPLLEPDVLLLEYHERSLMASGVTFEAAFCAIVRIRDGKIAHWREFFDPALVLAAFKTDAGESR